MPNNEPLNESRFQTIIRRLQSFGVWLFNLLRHGARISFHAIKKGSNILYTQARRDTRIVAHKTKRITSQLPPAWQAMQRWEKRAVAVLMLGAILSSVWFGYRSYLNLTYPVPTVGGTYTEGMLGQPKHVNPILATSEVDVTLTRLIFDSLYVSENGTLIPSLAAAAPVASPDFKEFGVTLKENIFWQSGKPITAEDVSFTINVIKDERYNSPLRSEWINTIIETPNPRTVIFKLKTASPQFSSKLTQPILSQAYWQSVDPRNFGSFQNLNLSVGSGPYAIKEIRKQNNEIKTVRLTRTNSGNSRQAYIETVNLSFFDSADTLLDAYNRAAIDGFATSAFNLSLATKAPREHAEVHSSSLPQYISLIQNMSSGILAEKPIRDAIMRVVDPKKIVADSLGNTAKILTNPLFYTDIPGTELNPAEAQTILTNAGWVSESATVRKKAERLLTVTLYTNESEIHKKISSTIKEQLLTVGITVQPIPLPAKELAEKIIAPRAFDLLLLTQDVGADPDPFLFWHSTQRKAPGLNLAGLNNPVADKLLNEARNTGDPAAAKAKYLEFIKLLQNESAVIYIAQNQMLYIMPDSIKNVNGGGKNSIAERFNNISDWYIETQRAWDHRRF